MFSVPILLFLLLFPLTAEGRTFQGTVLDLETGRPLPEARVRIQTANDFVLTDNDGKFILESDRVGKLILTAGKEGYLNAGMEVDSKTDALKPLELRAIGLSDNKDYRWLSPDPPRWFEWPSVIFWRGISLVLHDKNIKSHFASNCSNCHASTTIKEWRNSAHSQSAVNPIFLTAYNGTSISGKEGVFPGYRLDFPNSAGNCATCHAPAEAITNPFGVNLNSVDGVARQGVFCDLCHKVQGVELHPEGGFPGILSMKFRRPADGEQIFFGPKDDVIAGPDTYLPLIRESRFCAPCHSATFWGTPIYSEYDEWLESPYAKDGAEGETCQGCHMAPDKKSDFIAPAEKGGVKRDPETLATHVNLGSRDKDFLADAITMTLKGEKKGNIISTSVVITNKGAGHHFPTGVPMRNMILLVEAKDAVGNKLKHLEGPTVPTWGGEGPVGEGNYAGLPGKGFAKILADASKKFPRYDPESRVPTPHWRQAVIVSDTRIPAKESDTSEYRFECGEECQKPVTVTARLIYRRAFKEWIDAKGWLIEDMEIARKAEVIK